MTPDDVQSRIKTALSMIKFERDANVAIWALSQAIARDVKADKACAVRDAVLEVESRHKAEEVKVAEVYTDEEAVEHFRNNIKQKAVSGEFDAAFAGKIMDALNIKQKDRDITIKVVSYKDILD